MEGEGRVAVVDALHAERQTGFVTLMVLLCALVFLGLVAMWRWGSLGVRVPWAADPSWPLPPAESIRRFLWYATVGIAAGVISGIVMFGAGGRLAMRLLAITAGPAAQGRVTEAQEIVGEITLGGTLGFIVFFGILAGSFFGLVYVGVRRWLPSGRWGGLTYGLLLLVVLATSVDPLRPKNPDFDIVGPGGLAVLAFSAVLVGYGMLVAAIAARYSRWLPLLRNELKTIAHYVPAYVFWGPFAVVLAIPLILGCGVAALVARIEGLRGIAASRRVLISGRALAVVVAAATLPGFISGVADITSRG